jgi:uncharacterized membrane protein YvbJ
MFCPECGSSNADARSCSSCGAKFSEAPKAVHITGIHVPFWSVVGFMVKWSIASIPALFILAIIGLAIEGTIVLVSISLVHYFSPGALTSLLGPFRVFVPGVQ